MEFIREGQMNDTGAARANRDGGPAGVVSADALYAARGYTG